MSVERETGPGPAAEDGRDFEAWREEIVTFCRQTVTDLQQLLELMSVTEASSAEVRDDSRLARSYSPEQAAGVPPTVPRDLDASQDRLANLKRQLAAKLSNNARDEQRS